MDRRYFGFGILAVVAVLAVVAYVAPYFRQAMTPAASTAPAPAPKQPAKQYTGELPDAFSLNGTYDGEEPDPTFALPDATPIRVEGTSASAKGEREVDELFGADRLTGQESFVLKGTFDRKTNTIKADVVWSLDGRAGDRFISWRFKGPFKGWFITRNGAKGALTGTISLQDRYGSPDAAPQSTTHEQASWTYSGMPAK